MCSFPMEIRFTNNKEQKAEAQKTRNKGMKDDVDEESALERRKGKMKAKRTITEKKLGLIFVCCIVLQSSHPRCLNLNERSPCDVDKVTEPLRESGAKKKKRGRIEMQQRHRRLRSFEQRTFFSLFLFGPVRLRRLKLSIPHSFFPFRRPYCKYTIDNVPFDALPVLQIIRGTSRK